MDWFLYDNGLQVFILRNCPKSDENASTFLKLSFHLLKVLAKESVKFLPKVSQIWGKHP